MAKKKKESSHEVISQEQIQKFRRKARREYDLEMNSFVRGGAHLTSKSDIRDRTNNTVSLGELEELLEEELIDTEDLD